MYLNERLIKIIWEESVDVVALPIIHITNTSWRELSICSNYYWQVFLISSENSFVS